MLGGFRMNEQDSTMHKDGERRRRLTVWALAAGSLGLFLATLSRGAFPGLPARHLAWQPAGRHCRRCR